MTIHAGHSIPKANISHGCILVKSDAALWLNEQFVDKNTQVDVLDYARGLG